ncbi:MAG: hypothetical protein JSV49_04630 [Thermoplasmata archaeon]|nr:MAG: hypothetical protein JSV49_04630 [Thermoplasmata archaeon]
MEEPVIERELRLFFSYGVGISEAKRGVLKKLGDQQSKILSGIGGDKNLLDVKDGEFSINLKVKIMSVDTKTVTVDGESKEIYYGIMADESAALPFTAWQDFGLEKNSVLSIKSAYVKGFRGELQINLGNNTEVENLKSGELKNLTPERLAEYQQQREVEVGQLKPGMSNITVIGRVINVEAREVTVKDTKKTVFSGSLGDSSGKVQFSAWHNFNLKPGDVIQIDKCYVKSWRGIPQLSFDESSNVDFKEDTSLPSLEQINTGAVRQLIDFEDLGGGFDTSIEGVVLELRSGSGLIKRCPDCRRVLQDNQCMVHGAKTDGLIDIRVKAIVDDGTGSFMAVLGGALTEEILGISSDEYRNNIDEPGYSDEIVTQLKDKMLTQRYRLRGNVTRDNFGLMMIVQEISPIETDIKLETEKILDELRGI